jgi:hypothetical protein
MHMIGHKHIGVHGAAMLLSCLM